MTLQSCIIETDIGPLLLETDGTSLLKIEVTKKHATKNVEASLLKQVNKELNEYFQGKRMMFTLRLQAEGSNFQKRVWKAMGKIPYGKTKTYAEIAKAVGSPKAVRAVGSACGKNPLLLMIPCHRVVGSNGRLGGFSAGISRKKYLLALEKNQQS